MTDKILIVAKYTCCLNFSTYFKSVEDLWPIMLKKV